LALAQQLERCTQARFECTRAPTQHDVAHKKVKLVDKAMCKQVIEKNAAALDQQVVTGLSLEFSDPRMHACPAHHLVQAQGDVFARTSVSLATSSRAAPTRSAISRCTGSLAGLRSTFGQ
jgi:hypothetical protein